MNIRHFAMALFLGSATMGATAQTTYKEMEQLTVNEQVTTVIIASEPIRFVDISTDLVAGDQPINNTVRLKPKEAGHEDGEVLAIVTIVTERYRTQYALLYTGRHQQGGGAVGTYRLSQSCSVDVNGGHVPLCASDMDFAREVPQREQQETPHDHAAEQHLFGG